MANRAFHVFSHLNAEKVEAYRAVMRAFIVAKARFALHLRASDVRDGLANHLPAGTESLEVDVLLESLCDWGNIAAHPDTADVTTVEDFYRPRHLYQLTAEGEAAERAIDFFESALQKPGELSTTALDDIRSLLRELEPLALDGNLDGSKVHRVLSQLVSRFEELTSRAHSFIGSLQRTIDLHGFALDAFLAYKEMLIDYLERFIGELTVATVEIAEQLLAVEAHGVDRLLHVAAERDLADTFNAQQADREAALSLWLGRWQGLRVWFVREGGHRSQAEVLRARARSAIPALVNAVANIHDRRVNRSDRVQDFRTLARWFADAASDQLAHRLWRAAFALAPSRHLQVNEDTLAARDAQQVPAATSWLDAPPIEVAPRLRKTGRSAPRGPAKAIVNRTEEKAVLAAAMADETEQLRAARQKLATGRPMRLSEMGFLRAPEFGLLLDLLDEALTRKIEPTDEVETASSDETLVIRMWPVDGRAAIDTEDGWLFGQDHFLVIRDALIEEQCLADSPSHAQSDDDNGSEERHLDTTASTAGAR
jgi:uncharacterized protein (TIGR02677 family)